MYRLTLIFCLYCLSLFTEEILTYEKTSGKGSQKIVYTVKKGKEDFLVEIEGKDLKTTLVATNPFALKSYITKKKEDFFEFVLDGSIIKAKGSIQGSALSAEFKVTKKNPWIQEFDFGLRPLLASSKNSLNFQLINPKNFKIHKMVAKKVQKETLKIGTSSYDAQLIEISLQGFKSMFWKAQIWYDTKSYDLLQYKANEGPNTPLTIVTLVSKIDK